MSVHNLGSPDRATQALFGPEDQVCFLCGHRSEGLAVVWQGSTGRVVAHPNCAEALGIAFIRDSGVAKRVLEGKPVTAGIHQNVLPAGEA
jgi:hypothetical protein